MQTTNQPKRPVGRPPGLPMQVMRIRLPVPQHKDIADRAAVAGLEPDALVKKWIGDKLKRKP